MANKTKIFLCEDDESLGGLLKDFFESKEFEVSLFHNGEEALENFSKNAFDLCVLDVMMPRVDGFAVAEKIRSLDEQVPIIFLTAKTLKEDVLKGFKVGADDYIRKPFSLDELLARIEVLLRRVKGNDAAIMPYYQIGKYLFDTQNQTLAFEEEEPIRLTTKESDLLSLLCAFANRTLERSYALKKIWENDNYFNARSMDVYITKLRKMLKGDPTIEIMNVHGKGYRLVTNQGDDPQEDQVKRL